MKRLCTALLALTTAAALAGCGEIKNTLTPAPGSADHITIALDSAPKFNQVGIYEAAAAGYFKQADLTVTLLQTHQPLQAIQNGSAQLALTNEPKVMLLRNQHIALAGVAALVQTPALVNVSCKRAKAKHARPAAKTCTASRGSVPAQYAHAPSYNGLNLVVTESEIVAHAHVLRRTVQAIARGYIATRSNPRKATQDLVAQVRGLDYAEQLAGVRASLPNFFPSDSNLPWGFQVTKQWNAFGTWLLDHHVITNENAPVGASSNELLAGQGV